MAAFLQTTSSVQRRLVPAALLLTLVLVGLALYRGYGVPWDEFTDHQLGNVTATYIARKLAPASWQHSLPSDPRIPWLPTSGIVHGPVIETPAAVLGWLLYPNQPRGYYTVRHGFVYLVFVAGVLALYGLGWLRYRDWRLALLGAAMLVLSPRFFAEAFYNGKDVGFMALFTVAMLALARLAQRPTVGRALLAGCATAAAIGVRMPGVILPAFGLSWLAWQAWHRRGTGASGRLALIAGLYLGTTVVATIICWPYLWESPLQSFRHVLAVMSHVPWPGTVLYWGRLVAAPALPWHYLLVWIGITTPVSYVLAALLGLGAVGRVAGQALRRGRTDWPEQLDCLFALWLLAPLGAIIGLRSVVFDGWRHVYFVYPALILLALRGVQVLLRARQPAGRGRWLLTAVLALMALDGARSLWFIGRAWPNSQVYFSCVPAATAERLFERDYWGLSYRHGLEWVLCHDNAPVIAVTGPQPTAVYVNTFLLTAAQRRRIRVVSGPEARYYLTAYRWHPQSYADSLGPEVLAYRPGGGIKALSVFRRDSLRRPLPPTPIGNRQPRSAP